MLGIILLSLDLKEVTKWGKKAKNTGKQQNVVKSIYSNISFEKKKLVFCNNRAISRKDSQEQAFLNSFLTSLQKAFLNFLESKDPTPILQIKRFRY